MQRDQEPGVSHYIYATAPVLGERRPYPTGDVVPVRFGFTHQTNRQIARALESVPGLRPPVKSRPDGGMVRSGASGELRVELPTEHIKLGSISRGVAPEGFYIRVGQSWFI